MQTATNASVLVVTVPADDRQVRSAAVDHVLSDGRSAGA